MKKEKGIKFRNRAFEKCFFCNQKFPKELGRWLDIIETGMNKKTKKEESKCIGKGFVCFRCEIPCSTPPEFNPDGSCKKKDRGY